MSLPLPNSTPLREAMSGRFASLFNDDLDSLQLGDLRAMEDEDIVAAYPKGQRLVARAFVQTVVRVPADTEAGPTGPTTDGIMYESYYRGTVQSDAVTPVTAPGGHKLEEVKLFAKHYTGRLDLDLSNCLLLDYDLPVLLEIASFSNVELLRLRNGRLNATDQKAHFFIREIAHAVRFVDLCGNPCVDARVNKDLFQEFAKEYQPGVSGNVLDHLVFVRQGWFSSDNWKQRFEPHLAPHVEAAIVATHRRFYDEYPSPPYL